MSDFQPPPPEQPQGSPPPGWGQVPPPPGWGQVPPSPPPTPRAYVMPQETNGFAIASLVVGIIGLCLPFAGALAVAFGFIGRNQMRSSGQGGDGIAIAGTILGFIGISVTLLLVVGVITGPGSS